MYSYIIGILVVYFGILSVYIYIYVGSHRHSRLCRPRTRKRPTCPCAPCPGTGRWACLWARWRWSWQWSRAPSGACCCWTAARWPRAPPAKTVLSVWARTFPLYCVVARSKNRNLYGSRESQKSHYTAEGAVKLSGWRAVHEAINRTFVPCFASRYGEYTSRRNNICLIFVCIIINILCGRPQRRML